MNYKETLQWMFRQLPMYQRQGRSAFKKDLTNIKLFCQYLKNPQKNFKSVHVGGTNGIIIKPVYIPRHILSIFVSAFKLILKRSVTNLWSILYINISHF